MEFRQFFEANLLTPQRVGQLLGVAPRTVHMWISNHGLPASQGPGSPLISGEDLYDWMQKGQHYPFQATPQISNMNALAKSLRARGLI